MIRALGILPVACALLIPLLASDQEDFQIYTEHPRLFLRPARLRLLQRERERQSMRWMQFETLMAGKARMPEPGFAYALYYRISGDRDAGQAATRWALGPGEDLRQLAIVFDWCQDVLQPAEMQALEVKLQRGIEVSARDTSAAAARSRLLAAIALAGHTDEISTRQVKSLIHDWWYGRVAPELKTGRAMVSRDDIYPLFEFLHAVRDNLEVDLRESAPGFFKDLPQWQLLSYYPASYPAPANEFRIPAMRGLPGADLDRAALSRAAELSMVAYDTNDPESQALQGWLMHDNFLLRGPFGIPYELMWANPYQPGLSYYHVPLVYHDERAGRLFARSSWEEDASWAGYFGGEMQVFRAGKPALVHPGPKGEVIAFPDAILVCPGQARKFRIDPAGAEHVFVVGLKPSAAYELEIDGEELSEFRTDAGGILAFTVRPNVSSGFRFHEAR